jgi:DNA-directed RNA polymerase I subunit RPA2
LPGVKVGPGQPYFSYKNDADGKVVIKKYKHKEEAYIDQVTVIGAGNRSDKGVSRIGLKLRINRNPVVGDKFASRHGQKGVMSKVGLLLPIHPTDRPHPASYGRRLTCRSLRAE